MPLNQALIVFRNEVKLCNHYITSAFAKDNNGVLLRSVDEQNFIVESAFVKMYIAWETFIETTFIEYMMGSSSKAGASVGRCVSPIDRQHAHKILIGTQKYVDWSNPEIVRRLSNIYFGNKNPFEIYIGSINSDLFDLKTIRNSAAHLSSTTSQQLDALSNRKLGKPCSGMTAAGLLLALDPNTPLPATVLMNYQNVLDIAAEGIANGI